MFNRQPFNRGKFNVSSTQAVGNSGIGLMIMRTSPILANKIISANGYASLYMKENTVGTNVKYNNGITNLALDSYGNGTKVFIADSDISAMILNVEANQLLAGEEVISLEGLALKPGEEVVINTCDMTVTVNGQNAIQYFSNDSDFFKLLSGLNTIEYNDGNTSRNVSFDIIWKDRWL